MARIFLVSCRHSCCAQRRVYVTTPLLLFTPLKKPIFRDVSFNFKKEDSCLQHHFGEKIVFLEDKKKFCLSVRCRNEIIIPLYIYILHHPTQKFVDQKAIDLLGYKNIPHLRSPWQKSHQSIPRTPDGCGSLSDYSDHHYSRFLILGFGDSTLYWVKFKWTQVFSQAAF